MTDSAEQGRGWGRRGGYALTALALLTCPCHLPILAALLAGTALGAVITDHFEVVLALFSVVFLLSLTAALRVLARVRS